jgi:amidase
MGALESDIHYRNLTDVAGRIRRREIGARALTEHMLERIARLDPSLKAYVHVMADGARKAADAADRDITQGFHRGPLHGVPVGVKDLLYTTDAPTGGGTTIHAKWTPPHEATVVRRLRDAGAVILGKVKTSEGALFNHHPDIAAPVNPWKADRWPGISSSGSAVSVAAGLCYAAIGSDTGGSIRLPSTANGLTGLKPTYGRVSRHGVFALAETLDHVGPMARSAADAAAMLSVIAGADDNDPTALRAPVPAYLSAPGPRLDGVRIGVDPTFGKETAVAEPVLNVLTAAVEIFRAFGAEIVALPLPDSTAARQAGIALIAAEAASAHAETFPARANEYGPTTRDFLAMGHSLKATDLVQAQRAAAHYRARFLALYENVDLILMPVIPYPTPEKDVFAQVNGEGAHVTATIGFFTIILDIAGVPSLTVPGGFDSQGAPIGFQIVGNLLDEERVLQAGHLFQSLTDWHTKHPPV